MPEDQQELHDRRQLYVGGRWVEPAVAAPPIRVDSAADGSALGEVPTASAADVDRAVAAARSAFAEWSRTSSAERAEVLQRIRTGLLDRRDEIAATIALEVGTPLKIASAVQAGMPVKTLEAFAEAAAVVDEVTEIGNSRVHHRPAGVVGAITPWNYPLHQVVAKVGAALAAGCSIVVKPADLAPLSAFLLADAVDAAGVPPGVFNLVTGQPAEVGEALAGHPDIDVLSFTGSTRVGGHVASLAARHITRVHLELGGKSASLLLPDADLDVAVKASVNNAYLNSGQTCSAWTRLLVPRERRDEVLDRAVAAAGRLTVGHPLADTTRLGPLVSAQQRERVLGFIERGGREATLVTGGSERPDDVPDGGHYVAPTVFADVSPDSELAQEEVFGPVLAVLGYEDEEEAVAIANHSRYGLAGGVWGADREHAIAVAGQIRAGQVDVNGGAFNPAAPFGGFGNSGLGREFGPLGVLELTEPQSLQL